MFKTSRTFLLCVVVAAFILTGALGVIGSRKKIFRTPAERKPPTSVSKIPNAPPPRNARRSRNLSLSPESFNLSRRLGKRFEAGKQGQSHIVARLTLGTEQRVVQTTRKQTDDGEQIEIRIAGSPGLFTWNMSEGVMYSGARPKEAERDLVERLVFDSPDQFVLAQLRGASYYTVSRNVRPSEAADGYSGPLWNVMRVNDPEPDPLKRPRSPWRLYYINTQTGLIDKVESEVDGQRITAAMTWASVQGEQVPAQITWTRQGQTIMQYTLMNFSRAQQ